MAGKKVLLNLTMSEVRLLRQSLDSRLSASKDEAESKEMGLQPSLLNWRG